MAYIKTRKNEIYSDINNKLLASDREDVYKYDEESVHQAVVNLISTRPTERLFRPSYGNDLGALLFEPFDEITAQVILNKIVRMFADYEPRVELELQQTKVTPDIERNQYGLELAYRIKGIPNQIFSRVGILKQ